MDKRSLIALALIALVIVGGQLLMPRSPPPVAADSTSAATSSPPVEVSAHDGAVTRPSTSSVAPSNTPVSTSKGTARPETVTVAATDRVANFVTPGAAPVSVTLPEYKDLKRRPRPLSIVPTAGALLRYRIATGADTISLDDLAFTTSRS